MFNTDLSIFRGTAFVGSQEWSGSGLHMSIFVVVVMVGKVYRHFFCGGWVETLVRSTLAGLVLLTGMACQERKDCLLVRCGNQSVASKVDQSGINPIGAHVRLMAEDLSPVSCNNCVFRPLCCYFGSSAQLTPPTDIWKDGDLGSDDHNDPVGTCMRGMAEDLPPVSYNNCVFRPLLCHYSGSSAQLTPPTEIWKDGDLGNDEQ
jgi:hypothetical protein